MTFGSHRSLRQNSYLSLLSLVFEAFILIGYICGIIRKSLQVSQGIALDWIFILGFVFYFINMTAVIIDMCLWVRNHHLDIMRQKDM